MHMFTVHTRELACLADATVLQTTCCSCLHDTSCIAKMAQESKVANPNSCKSAQHVWEGMV